MSKINLCDQCRWYGGFFAPDSAHLCNAPDAGKLMDRMLVIEIGQDEPTSICRHYAKKQARDYRGRLSATDAAANIRANLQALNRALDGAASFPQHHEDDSREKLEADIWAGCEHLTMADKGEAFVNVPCSKLLGWLDRQAEITRRECSPEAIDGMLNTIGEIEEKLGVGECECVWNEQEGTFHCSSCDTLLTNEISIEWPGHKVTPITLPNYCRNCGKAVKR